MASKGLAGRTPTKGACSAHRGAVHPQRYLPHPVGRPQRPSAPTGTKSFHPPVVGDLDLSSEAMDLSADPGLTLHIDSAQASSPSADALQLLASWVATLYQVQLASPDQDEQGNARQQDRPIGLVHGFVDETQRDGQQQGDRRRCPRDVGNAFAQR